MDGLATHGERPLQPHTQLQEKSISRRGVEFHHGHCHWRSPPTGNPGFAPTLSGQVSSTILRASGLKVSRGLPNVDGNAAMIFVLRRGKKRYACHPDPKRERLAPGMNSPHWCLDCGERTRVDSGAPMAVVFMVALCSRTTSLKDVNFTRHRPSSQNLPPRRLPGSPARIESSGIAGAPLIHHDTVRGLSTDAINSFPPLRQGS